MNKNILFISSYGNYLGGGQRSEYITIKHLREKEDITLFLMVPETGDFSREVSSIGIKVFSQELSGFFSFNLIKILSSVKALFKIIKENNVDIIECDTPRYCIYGIILKYFTNIKIVLHIRVSEPAFVFDNILAFFLDGIISVSNDALQRIPKIILKKVRNEIIFNAVELENKIPERTDNRINLNEIRIGFAGRVSRKKGIYDVVEVSRLLEQKKVKFKVFIAGDFEKDFFPDLNSKILSSGLADKIVFLGWIDSMTEFYKKIDILFFPSYYQEGLPRVIIESQAYGLPVISYDVPGVKNIIIDRETGYLIKKGDYFSVTEKILDLSENIKLYNELSKKSFVYIKKNFSVDVHINKIYNFFNKL